MLIQLTTVSRSSDPSDYWDEKYYQEKTVWNEYLEKDESEYHTRNDIDNVLRLSSANSFVVDTDVSGERYQDDVDAVVKVYDGYNE